mmetsp:Transcript_92990/g.206885  ORF Transcript_92990/g.206885 Transcript_92990/m.206885 type:complete len:210 (+) Transcript_92990:1945-2574(+)
MFGSGATAPMRWCRHGLWTTMQTFRKTSRWPLPTPTRRNSCHRRQPNSRRWWCSSSVLVQSANQSFSHGVRSSTTGPFVWAPLANSRLSCWLTQTSRRNVASRGSPLGPLPRRCSLSSAPMRHTRSTRRAARPPQSLWAASKRVPHCTATRIHHWFRPSRQLLQPRHRLRRRYCQLLQHHRHRRQRHQHLRHRRLHRRLLRYRRRRQQL